MTQRLIVLADLEELGVVEEKNGKLSFEYAGSWLDDQNAYPISLSMPHQYSENLGPAGCPVKEGVAVIQRALSNL